VLTVSAAARPGIGPGTRSRTGCSSPADDERTARGTRLTGQTEGELLISLWENPAENVMEAGLIFPGLGQEQQWFEENRDRLAELGIL
jgi:hypothetical protein